MEHLLLQTLFPLKEPKGKEKEVVVVVAVVGEWHGHDMGSFKITADDLENMRANAEAQKTDVVIDYEHQTLYGGQAPAAGWISKLEVKDNELLGTVTWTSKATKHIKEGEYKYLSPVYAFNSRDPKTDAYIGLKLHSVALTNTPFMDELGEVKANKKQTKPKENFMDDKKPKDANSDAQAQLEAENVALKEELATQKVERAIAAKKITPEQKEWALTYCKENAEGFDKFVASQKEQKQVPANNTFANKQHNSNDDNTPDVVAMALNN